MPCSVGHQPVASGCRLASAPPVLRLRMTCVNRVGAVPVCLLSLWPRHCPSESSHCPHPSSEYRLQNSSRPRDEGYLPSLVSGAAGSLARAALAPSCACVGLCHLHQVVFPDSAPRCFLTASPLTGSPLCGVSRLLSGDVSSFSNTNFNSASLQHS